MRRVRIVLGLAVGVCAFGALSVPAFAKEKLVFGTFVASVAGQTISPTSPARVVENKEDEAEVTELQIGGYRFGVVNSETGEIEYENPCKKTPRVKGVVTEERSSSLLTEITFRECVSSNPDGAQIPWKASNFKLDIKFRSDESAELGNSEGGFEIAENATEVIKGVNGSCLLEVPKQFVPARSTNNEEKFWEAAEYTPETEPVENWEKSKKLQEEYPGGVKDRLEIETTEKFVGIVSYVDTATTKKRRGCVAKSGEGNGKLITEGPHAGWIEYNNGKLGLNAEGLEIKGGQLTFEPPA
jgi:hypothetical protein